MVRSARRDARAARGVGGRLRLVEEGLPELPARRPAGIHVSSLVRQCAIERGIWSEDGLPADEVRMELGSAWERGLVERLRRQHPERYVRPDPMSLDGVWLTPDLVDIDDWVVEEIKLTWLSSSHDPLGERFWPYWAQVKAYCMALETGIGRLRMVHVNGDYRQRTRDPVARLWEMRWTRAEIEANWRELMRARTAITRGDPVGLLDLGGPSRAGGAE